MYEVHVLKDGYNVKEGPGKQRSCGSITLLKGPRNVIVDTGNPWDKELILEALRNHNLEPNDIHYVVCTRAHGDKVGNLNLFGRAVGIVAGEVSQHQHYHRHGFTEGIPYEIDDDVEVIATPGHTGSDVSVIVRNTKKGTVAITGDLFERLEDLEDFSLWQENSEFPEVQQQNRLEILRFADWIVPGHGPMFQVPYEYKAQLKMVMYQEFKSTTVDGVDGSMSSFSETNYTVIEED
ncbi:metallo-beta-lactamase domain-containing protein 1-like isoform X2 [Ruditapes philippinarum]|uniref:metallo-beta-lactamase domain-containing protein 1-like isoform X2 n=1 Tax=Ruditapes philippinarum TaxID=129788 RepID=UPI00295C1144|nr:metallo-beta-lactamase domain-containing protein 1-like isoform X2 [Ruditapes philippinarum]